MNADGKNPYHRRHIQRASHKIRQTIIIVKSIFYRSWNEIFLVCWMWR